VIDLPVGFDAEGIAAVLVAGEAALAGHIRFLAEYAARAGDQAIDAARRRRDDDGAAPGADRLVGIGRDRRIGHHPAGHVPAEVLARDTVQRVGRRYQGIRVASQVARALGRELGAATLRVTRNEDVVAQIEEHRLVVRLERARHVVQTLTRLLHDHQCVEVRGIRLLVHEDSTVMADLLKRPRGNEAAIAKARDLGVRVGDDPR